MRRARPRRWLVRGGVAFLGLLALAGSANAHEFVGQKLQAPVSLNFVFVGGAVVVGLTAAWLATTEGTPFQRTVVLTRVSHSLVTWTTRATRVGFFLLFVFVIWSGITGPRNPLANVATVFVWAGWLKGVAFLAAAIGSPWRVLSPWRTLYEALSRIEKGEIALFETYPSWLGEWPALLGYVLWLGLLATLTVVPRSPRLTAALLAGYATFMLLGGIAFGLTWFERADALAVFYRLFGRVAPIRFERAGGEDTTDEYRIELRAPWRGCSKQASEASAVAFAVAAVYTVSFDGFRNTPTYVKLSVSLQEAFGPAVDPLLYLFGFGLFLIAFDLVIRLAEAGSDTAGSDVKGSDATRMFAPTVVPIAVAYEVAHFYPSVLRSLVRTATILLGDLGIAVEPFDPIALLPLSAIWLSQVGLIVGGHVVAVVAGHMVARRRYGEDAPRAHAPITAMMIGYTLLSLWIISRPFAA